MGPRTRSVIIVLLAFIGGYALGYSLGVIATLDWAVDTGLRVLNISEEELGLSKDLVINYLQSYRGRLGI